VRLMSVTSGVAIEALGGVEVIVMVMVPHSLSPSKASFPDVSGLCSSSLNIATQKGIFSSSQTLCWKREESITSRGCPMKDAKICQLQV
jgi:hypothetical protein